MIYVIMIYDTYLTDELFRTALMYFGRWFDKRSTIFAQFPVISKGILCSYKNYTQNKALMLLFTK